MPKPSVNEIYPPKTYCGTYSLFERDDFVVGEGISLGNDGNKVDFGMEATHKFDINLF